MLLRTQSDHVVAEFPAPAWPAYLSWGHHGLLSHTATGFIWVFSVYLDPLLVYFNLLEENTDSVRDKTDTSSLVYS